MDLRTALKNGKLLSIVFIISAAASLVAITPEIANHVEFYKALENIQFTLKNVTINAGRIDQGEVYIAVRFNVTNPTGFAKLTITGITCHLNYLKDQNLVYLTGTTKPISPPTQINAHQSVIIQIDFALTYAEAHTGASHEALRLFIGYLESDPLTVDWIITGQYIMYLYTNPFAYQMDLLAYSTHLN